MKYSVFQKILIILILFSSQSKATTHFMTLYDPILGTRPIAYQLLGQYLITEGDILINWQRSKSPGALITPKISGKRWISGTVAYTISNHLPEKNKNAVFKAIAIWQKNTNIQFILRHQKNATRYPDYILFTPSPGRTCASHVGRQGNEQKILLAPRCGVMSTVHEIGHAIGLWHEQSRADRDQFIQIIWDNITPEHRFNFSQHLYDGQDYKAYNYDSIMHYKDKAFSKNGEKTMIPLQEGVTIGQRDHLSQGDIAAINAMYP